MCSFMGGVGNPLVQPTRYRSIPDQTRLTRSIPILFPNWASLAFALVMPVGLMMIHSYHATGLLIESYWYSFGSIRW